MADFLGTGWAFPVRRGADARGGPVAVTGGDAHVEESIHVILGTVPGERVMRPEFGCAVHDLLFAPDDPTTAAAACAAVRDALVRWEPRIDVLDVRPVPGEPEPGRIVIEIDYRVRATNSRLNLVYPFSAEAP